MVAMQIHADHQGHEDEQEGQREQAHAVGVVAEGAAVDGVGADDQAAAEQVGPGGRRGRTGEGDGGRADLERHDQRGQADGERQQEQEGARDRAEGEGLGEEVGRVAARAARRRSAARTTQSAAAPASTRCSSDATSQIRPTTLWSPEPRIDASPVAAGAGAVGSEDAGAAAGASSVTVMQAPGTRDGWCSGI